MTAGTAVLLAAVGVRAGCAATDLRGALFRAYGWTAAYVFTCGVPCLWPLSPVGAVAGLYLYGPTWRPAAVALAAAYPVAQVVVAMATVRDAARHLRREEDLAAAARKLPAKPLEWQPEPEADEPFRPEDFVPAPVFLRPGPKPRYPTERPVLLDDDPLIWKEMYITGRLPLLDDETARAVARVAGKAAGFAAAVLMLFGFASAASGGAVGRQMLLFGGVTALTAYAAAVGAAAVASVTGERRQRTLDALRALPVDRSAILSAKWLVCWERGPPWGLFGLLAVGASLLGEGPVVAGAGVGLAVAGLFVVVNGGFWLSVRVATPGAGARWLLALVAGFAATPVAVWYAADLTEEPGTVARVAGGAAVFGVLLARGLWRAAVRELEWGG